MPSKSFSALKARLAYEQLRNLKLKISNLHDSEGVEEPDVDSMDPGFEQQLDVMLHLLESMLEDSRVPAPEGFKQQLEVMLHLLKSKLEESQSLTFSGVTDQTSAKLNITLAGILDLKPNLEKRIAETISLGQDEFWSSANLYRQLHVLEGLLPGTKEASSRAWIDTFFFRVSAMLPPSQRMVLNMEHTASATTISPSSSSTLSGFVDYTVVVADQRDAAFFRDTPDLNILKFLRATGFFVIQAKLNNPSHHVPHAVAEIYACGKFLQKKILRGALTNGRDWIFILVTFNDNFDGATYKQSDVISIIHNEDSDGKIVIPGPRPDLIAAILLHWVENSFADLGNDDWFE
ncbi:hypothetical protein D9615_005460 [Tricholomella constricta]|uniref:Uncharacterized protein n=1 Tax=Tricholomella constricta TaxID=117010 RepID=A0A8H5M5H9_9AGAR|nr:hypothetical protein D9615_005460 [Tricholomella constricta]